LAHCQWARFEIGIDQGLKRRFRDSFWRAAKTLGQASSSVVDVHDPDLANRMIKPVGKNKIPNQKMLNEAPGNIGNDVVAAQKRITSKTVERLTDPAATPVGKDRMKSAADSENANAYCRGVGKVIVAGCEAGCVSVGIQ